MSSKCRSVSLPFFQGVLWLLAAPQAGSTLFAAVHVQTLLVPTSGAGPLMSVAPCWLRRWIHCHTDPVQGTIIGRHAADFKTLA